MREPDAKTLAGWFLNFVVLLLVVAITMWFAQIAGAHTLGVQECSIFAKDAATAAHDRDVGATYKMQYQQAVDLLTKGPELRGPVCIYKDEADVQEALNTLAWLYGPAAKMKPNEVEAKVRDN